MANEIQVSGISSLIDPIRERALWYATHNFIMPRLVTTFNARGMFDRVNSQYAESSSVTDNLGETTDLSNTAFTRALLSTLTPKEVGKQHIITDRRIETDPENIVADAIRNIGYAVGKKLEIDLLALFANLTGGVLGSESSSMSLSRLYAARARLEKQGVPGPYIVVLDSYQWLDIHAELTALDQPAPLSIRDNASQNYFVVRIADFVIYVTTMATKTAVQNEVQTVTISGSPTGGTFKLSFAEQPTGNIAYNAAASAVQSALEALANIGSGNVAVTGSDGGPYTVTFQGALAGENVPTLAKYANALTGGTSPDVAVVETTPGKNYAYGAMFTRDAMAFDLRRALRIEPQRDASLRSTELNATMIYAVGTWVPANGIILKSDASQPLS